MILCSNFLGRYKSFPVFREEGAVSLYVLEVGCWQRGEPGSCWIFWGTLGKRGSQFFKEKGCDPRRLLTIYFPNPANKLFVRTSQFKYSCGHQNLCSIVHLKNDTNENYIVVQVHEWDVISVSIAMLSEIYDCVRVSGVL